MSRNQIQGRTAAEIASSVERALDNGKLTHNQKLPPIRELARSIGVSPVTVAAAYRQLQSRGVAVAGGRRGTILRALPGSPALMPGIVARTPDELTDLATGNPDPALLPAIDPLLRRIEPPHALYGSALELPALAAFAAAEFAADGVAAGQLAVTSGSLDALERVLREHARPGDGIGLEDPTLPAVRELVASLGLVPRTISVDDEGPRPESLDAALRTKVAAVIVSPRAQNPTGATLTESRARDLSHVLRRRSVAVLIEIDDMGPVSGSPLRTLTTGRAHWALVRSTSKWLGPDLRLAVAIGDPLTIGRLRRRQAVSVRWVSHILQRLALALWSDPASGRLLARAAQVYHERRAALIDALATAGITAHGSSGFNVWIPVRAETAAVQFLASRGWAVAPGEPFRAQCPPAIRVTTSALVPEDSRRFVLDFAAADRQRAVPSA